MVAWANKDVFLQIWIGVDDKLPRQVRAIYAADPLHLRNDLELSDWKVDSAIAPGAFTSQKALAASRIAFANPASRLQPGVKPRGTEHTNAYVGTTGGAYGNTWFQPVYGANGVYYTVVAAP